MSSDFSIVRHAILKEAWASGENLDRFRIQDSELGVYLIFLENSTRTKESFRNAARFHNVKLNIFRCRIVVVYQIRESG